VEAETLWLRAGPANKKHPATNSSSLPNGPNAIRFLLFMALLSPSV
jgi:hypothetical protein